MKDVYLGDGLYASFDGFPIEVYAFNGAGKTDRVFLEAETLQEFLKFIERVKEAAK